MTIVDPTTRRIRGEFHQIVIGVLVAADVLLAAAVVLLVVAVTR